MPYNLQSLSSYLRLRRREIDLVGDIHVNRRHHVAPLLRVKGGYAECLQRRSHIFGGTTLFFAVGQQAFLGVLAFIFSDLFYDFLCGFLQRVDSNPYPLSRQVLYKLTHVVSLKIVHRNIHQLVCLEKKVKMKIATVGKWAFIVGLVLAILAGLFFQVAWVVWVLAILGVIVGILYITTEETQTFLLAAVAITLSATALNTIPLIGEFLKNILGFVAAFVAGAMLIVGLKAIILPTWKPAIKSK
jgi:hypothetical protein